MEMYKVEESTMKILGSEQMWKRDLVGERKGSFAK